jgi:methyl-accepting chemotaxis protein
MIMDLIYNMNLRKKLYIVFGSLIIGTIVSVSLGITAFSRVQVGGPAYSAIEQNMLIADNIAKLRANLAFIRTTLLTMLIEDNPEMRKKLRENIADLSTRTEELFDIIIKELQASDHAKALASMSTAREAWTAFKETGDKELIPLIFAGNIKQAMMVARGGQAERYLAFSVATKEAVDEVRSNVPSKVGQMKRESAVVKWLFVFGCAFMVMVYLLLTVFFSKTIITPVTMITDRSEYMARGDFSRIGHAALGTDEIGKMKTNFSTMSNKVRETLAHIKSSMLHLSSSSEQLSATAEHLHQGSGEQSHQVKEVTTAITEMSQTVGDVAQNAGQSAEAAKNSAETSEGAKEIVEMMTDSLVAIMAAVKESMSTIEGLSKSSAQIGEIVTLIHSIADQTNLLALNAAIEAARAGEQGRGFAVVADEVRKLADKTTLATKDIEQKISSVRNEAGKSLATVRKGHVEAEKGVGLSRAATQALDSLVKASTSEVDMVQRIAAATEELSATSEEIMKNMNGISGVIDRSSQATDQIKQAAHALAALATEIQSMTNWFKTEVAETK